MKETLSALMDGECTPSELDRLLSELERDPSLREHFSRQCMARESRMGTRIRSAKLDFSSRVLAALHSEDTPVVVALGDRVRRLPWRKAASLAAAAAVGALAVLVVRPDGAPVSQGIPVAQTGTLTAAEGAAAEPVETQFAELDDENARQLRNYMVTYSQSRAQQGVGSTLGYARYAAYTNDERPAARTAENKR